MRVCSQSANNLNNLQHVPQGLDHLQTNKQKKKECYEHIVVHGLEKNTDKLQCGLNESLQLL